MKLYLLLLAEADEDTAATRTSVRLLATKLEVSDRTVISALGTLEEIGLIRQETRSPGPFLTTYTITSGSACPESASPPAQPDPDDLSAAEGSVCQEVLCHLNTSDTAAHDASAIENCISGSSGVHAEPEPTLNPWDDVVKGLSGWYRPLTDSEQRETYAFVLEQLGLEPETFLDAVMAGTTGVCQESPFVLFLSVLRSFRRAF